MKRKWLTSVCFCLFAATAAAEPETKFSLGVVFSHFDNPLYKSSTRNIVLPSMNFSYYDDNFFIDEDVGYAVWGNSTSVINVIGSINLDFLYFLDRSDALDKIRKRRVSFLGGIELLYFPNWGDVQIQYIHDIVRLHQGEQASFVIRTSKRFQNLEITPKLGVRWKSGQLLNYYYGVDSRDNLPFPDYTPSHGIDLFGSIQADYRVDYHWIVGGFIHVAELSNQIRLSPIVDKNQTLTAAFGIKYVF